MRLPELGTCGLRLASRLGQSESERPMKTPLRVLIVEDSESDACLVVRGLEQADYDVDWVRVETGEELRAALAEKQWDIVLADYTLPTFSAPLALETVKATGQDLPFIIISGTIGEEAAVAALKAGAHDFMLKRQLSRLAPAVEREIREAAERRAHRSAAEHLARLEKEKLLLLESTGEGIFGMDCQGRCTFMNPAAAAMLGCDPREAIGTAINRLVGSARVATHEPGDGSSLAAGRRGDDETFSRADGSTFPVEYSYHPIWDGGTLKGAVVVFSDITARKQADEARLRHTKELERFYQLAVGRELRMIELKNEVNALCVRLGELTRYSADIGEPTPATVATRQERS